MGFLVTHTGSECVYITECDHHWNIENHVDAGTRFQIPRDAANLHCFVSRKREISGSWNGTHAPLAMTERKQIKMRTSAFDIGFYNNKKSTLDI